MRAYIPIVIYKLPGDEYWTADALGLEGAVTEGATRAEAKKSLISVLSHYVDMLSTDDPSEAAELAYLTRLTAPPEGVEWIPLDYTEAAIAEAADAV